VHIASWWLRRWLWRLRDAALDGDEVLRFFRRRRAAEEAAAAAPGWQQAAGNALRSAARRVLRSAKSLLVLGRNDGGAQRRLSRTLARLEREAMALGDFLKLLDLEIRRSLPPAQPASPPRVFYAKCILPDDDHSLGGYDMQAAEHRGLRFRDGRGSTTTAMASVIFPTRSTPLGSERWAW